MLTLNQNLQQARKETKFGFFWVWYSPSSLISTFLVKKANAL